MDELKAKLAEVCGSMSTEQIAEAIANSRHGGSVDDPMAVAALLKSWC